MPTISQKPKTTVGSRMLDQLGSTPDEVALSLKSLGIKGVRHTVRFLNPIVRYAQTQVPGPSDLDVITGHSLRIRFPDGTQNEVPLPAAVVGFLDAFHRGSYPEIEEKP